MTSAYGKGDPNVTGVRQQYGKDIGSLVRDYQRAVRDAASLGDYSIDKSSYEEAYRTVKTQYSNLPFEQQNKLVENLYTGIKNTRDKERTAKIKALATALEEGAGVLPEVALLTSKQHEAIKSGAPWKYTKEQALHRLVQETANEEDKVRIFSHKLKPEELATLAQYREEEQWGAPSKRQPLGWTGQIERALNFPSRLVTGGMAGALGEARRQTADVPVGEETRFAGVPVAKAMERVSMSDLFGSAGESAWRAATRPGESDISSEMQAAKYRYTQAAEQQARKELGPPQDPGQESEFNKRVEQLTEQFIEKDAGELGIRYPNATEFTLEMLADPLNFVNPGKSAVAGAKAAAKLPGIKQGLQAAEKVYEGSTAQKQLRLLKEGAEGFTFAPELKNLEKLDPALAEVATLTRASHDRGITATREFGKGSGNLLHRIKKGSELDDQTFYDALNTPGISMAERRAMLQPEALDAFDAAVELAGKSLDFQKTGSYQRWNSKEPAFETMGRQKVEFFEKNAKQAKENFRSLLDDEQTLILKDLGKRVEFYENAGNTAEAERFQRAYNAFKKSVPNQYKKSVYQQVDEALGTPGFEWKHGTAELEAAGVVEDRIYSPRKYVDPDVEKGPTGPSLGKNQAGSTMRRTGETSELPRETVYNAWKKHLTEITNTVPAEQIVKTLHDETAKRGFIHKTAYISDPSAVIAEQQRLKEATGLDYVALKHKDDLTGAGDVYKRITAKPGTRRVEETIFVPKDYARYVESFRPLFGLPEHASYADKMLKGMDSISHGYMRLWRWMTVVPHLSSRIKDITGGFGLATVGLGTKALDPVLHAKAGMIAFAEASGLPGARKLAEGMTWKGAKLSDVLDVARSVGLTKQLEGHLVEPILRQEGLGHTLTDVAEKYIGRFGDTPGVRQISPSAVSAMGENYQHLVQFMGFLDDKVPLSPLSIARALDDTSKWASNYNRMGAFEKGAMRNVLGFYAWHRFVFPMMMQALYEKPEILAAWAKTRGGLDRYLGENAPVASGSLPAYYYGSMAARATAQPQEYIKELGSHKSAIMRMEDPLTIGFGLLPALQNGLGLKSTGGGERLAELAGPMAQFAAEIVLGRRLDNGAELPPMIDFSSPSNLWNSRVIQLFSKPVERFSTAWSDMYQLYKDRDKPSEAIDLALRYKAAHTLEGLDNWVARGLGAEPRSIGGMFDPLTGGTPGMITQLIDPAHYTAARSKRAIAERGLTEWQYKKTPDWLDSSWKEKEED
jgi:hypothetical protein